MNLANLCITTLKGTFQVFLNHLESQWLLVNKSIPISDQESPAVCKSMLCDDIHSNPDFLQVEHLDKLGQAQGTSKITYHNYLQCTTGFQLDLKRPKCSRQHTQVNNTNSTSNQNHNKSGHGGKGHSQNAGHGNDNQSTNNPNHISIPRKLWESLPASAKTSISEHNHQYNVNTAEQDDAGHIPKALWDQLPPQAKSAISNSQCHTKQQSNSINAHSNDPTHHSVTDTLPMFASNSVHHILMEIAPTSNNKMLNSILHSPCSTTSNMQSININSSDCLIHSYGSSYTVNMAHGTYQCSKPFLIPLDHLLMEEATVVWLVLMSACWNTLNNMQTIWE